MTASWAATRLRWLRAFADFAGVAAGQRVIDVGCGPGALTTHMVELLGPASVTAVDPSESFVDAARERHAGVTVERAAAEPLPFADGAFDGGPRAARRPLHDGSRRRPARDGARDTRGRRRCRLRLGSRRRRAGSSCACTGTRCTDSILTSPARPSLAGAREGRLAELLGAAGLHDIEESDLTVRIDHASFEEWWEPYTLGVGPAGDYVASLDPERLAELRERCRAKLPAGTVHGRRSGMGQREPASSEILRSDPVAKATGFRDLPDWESALAGSQGWTGRNAPPCR